MRSRGLLFIGGPFQTPLCVGVFSPAQERFSITPIPGIKPGRPCREEISTTPPCAVGGSGRFGYVSQAKAETHDIETRNSVIPILPQCVPTVPLCIQCYCTATTVPTGISEKNLRAVSSGNRMQPCDAGWFGT